MTQASSADTGKLILRITCAGLLLFHGSYKLFGEIESTASMVEKAGLPGILAYGTIVGEFVAPIFIIVGYKTRLAALVVAFNMLCSILIAHRDIMFKVNDYWGWMIELNVFFMMAAISIFFLGAGKWSLSRGTGKWD
jgi:putative oxidoreductase